jgi:hypothetical protein
MVFGVFTPAKQALYIQEVEEHYYPMIKKARRAFGSQRPAYENLKIMLRSQCHLIEATLEASAEPSPVS